MSTNRLESFSDGVIAVAITLLVLGISVPETGLHPSEVAHRLGTQWPEYVAYIISFTTIGIIWINHHAMISRLREADHSILLINLLLLMTVSILPFATDLIAKHDTDRLAGLIYGGALAAMALTFSLLNRQVLLVRPELLAEPLPLAQRQRIFRVAASGVVPYLVATPLALISPFITLAISGVLAVFYASPLASGQRRRHA